MLIFWPLCLLFIISYQISWGICSFSFPACLICLSCTTEEDLRGNAHFSHFPFLLSLFSFLFSSTIPFTQGWGTTMLVINFLIPFISLSPLPVPPLLSVYSWLPVSLLLSLLLTRHLSASVSSVFSLSCGQQVSSAPPTHLHTSRSQNIIPSPVHYCSTIPVTHLSVWSFDPHDITAPLGSIWSQNMIH